VRYFPKEILLVAKFVPKGLKRDLIEMEMKRVLGGDPSTHLEQLALIGKDYLRDFRMLLSEGGKREYYKEGSASSQTSCGPAIPW